MLLVSQAAWARSQAHNMLEKIGPFFRNHGTKMLGFGQVTVGAVAAGSGDLLSPIRLKILIMVSGVLTAWRGFVNSKNLDP